VGFACLSKGSLCLSKGKNVNIWIARGVSALALSAGLVAVGASTAQAATPADINPSDLAALALQTTSAGAGLSQETTQGVDQSGGGLVKISNPTALTFGSASASANAGQGQDLSSLGLSSIFGF
jgi:hypothetical protein